MHLVLYRDVGTPWLMILGCEPGRELRLQASSRCHEMFTVENEGYAVAHVANADYPDFDRSRHPRRFGLEDILDLRKMLRGELVEHGYVRSQKVAIRREELRPEIVEEQQVLIVHMRCQYQWRVRHQEDLGLVGDGSNRLDVGKIVPYSFRHEQFQRPHVPNRLTESGTVPGLRHITYSLEARS